MRIAVGLKHLRQVTTTAPIPAAATLAWTSGTSVRDPVFTLTGILAGDIVQLQIDEDPAFGSTYGDDTNTVDSTEAADGQLTFSGISTLAYATTYYARARITRSGQTSAWSNSASKTIDAAPATTFDPANRNTNNAQLSNGNFTITGVDQAAPQCARTTTTVASGEKKYFEVKVNTLQGANSFIGLGTCDDAFVFASTFNTPGATSHGAGLNYNGYIYPSTTPFIAPAVGSPSEAVNGILQCCAKVTGTTLRLWIGYNNTWNGNPSAETGGETFTLPNGNCYGWASVNRVDVCTGQFSAASQTYSPPTGAVAWGS